MLLAAGILVYANSVSNPFVFDDESSIAENDSIRHLASPSIVLFPERELAIAGRPIVNVSLAINYAIDGLDARGYHVWNITIHLLCAVLLFATVSRALRLPSIGTALTARASSVGFAAALLWLLHPLNSEAVDYLTQRTESMMTLFYLLTLYASLRSLAGVHGRPEGLHYTSGGRPDGLHYTSDGRLGWQVLAVVSCALGMGCKESMATAPAMVVLFDRIFAFGSFGEALKARWRLYAGLAATWVVLFVLLSTGPRTSSAGFSSGVSAWTYLLNQPPLITRYLGLVLWPRSLVAIYGWPVPRTLGDIAPYAAFVVVLLGLTLAGLRRRPQLGFLGAWFFITLAPTSSIIPISTEAGAERRMYLPLMALSVLATVGAAQLLNRFEREVPRARDSVRASALGVAAALMLGAFAAALGAGTFVRNREYASGVTLARTAVERHPTPVAHHVLAEQLLVAGGRHEEAMQHLRQALPGAPRAHYTLGVELFKERRLDEAIPELRLFIQEQPRLAHVIEAHGYLGKAFMLKEDWSAAAREFREILKITPINPPAEHSLADALFAAEAFDEAIVHYLTYLESQPNDPDALNQLGIAQGSLGRANEAVLTLRRAAEIDPTNEVVQKNLNSALILARRPPARSPQ